MLVRETMLESCLRQLCLNIAVPSSEGVVSSVGRV